MRRFSLAFVLPLALAVTGCEGTWKAGAECSSGGGCSVKGEVGGTFAFSEDKVPLAQRMMMSSSIPDAAAFEIDVSGSSVGVPSSGWVTLQLVERRSGLVQAARQFRWVRSGSVIRVAEPDVVNSWAAQSGGVADTLKYDLHQFQAHGGSGTNVLKVSSKYEGQVKASATASWSGGRPGDGGCGSGAVCQIQ